MEFEVTISTDTKQAISKAPAVVTVITAADIKATGATNLTEVLEAVPGIHVRSQPFANRPLIQFRGANATQTLLMINGNSMRDLMWGFGIFWKGLPTSVIERIEIIRGPGSALFGSDASAGVINVITKTAESIDHSEIGVQLGSFGTKTAWMQTGGSWNGFDIAMTANVYDTDGHNPYIESDGEDTAITLAPGHAQYGWKNRDFRFSLAKDQWRLNFAHMGHSDLETGLTGAGILDPVTSANDSRYNIDLLYQNEEYGEHWGLDAELRYQHLDYSSGEGFQEHPPSIDYPDGEINQMRSAERRLAFEVSGLYKGIENHAIRLGTGYTWQDLYSVEQYVNSGTGPDGSDLPPGSPLVDLSDTPYAFAPEKTRRIYHLFLQDVWTISEDWELTAGARYDHYSDFGDTLNPRLALVWNTTDRLTTKLMYGEAFRAPSYQELFAVTANSLPNANLKPERSKTLDLAFTYAATKDLHFNLNAFHFIQNNIIRSISLSGEPKRFQNAGNHTITGIELEAQWQATRDLRISGNYTARNPEDSNFRSIDEPDNEAYLRADWRYKPHWNLNLQANWVGERDRRDTDPRDPVDDYLIADATLRYNGVKNWEFAASVRNIFNEDAREYTGASLYNDFPLPGRSFFLEARYSFDDLLK